jgi:uncharacterized membrane protein
VAALAFRKNGIKFTSTGLDKVIKNNVFYPDMKCFLQLLAEYLIPASLVKLTVEQLRDLSGYAAILYMFAKPATAANAYYYVYMEKVEGNKIIYYTAGGKKIQEDLEEFKTKWDGVTLLFIKTRHIKERNYYFNLVSQLLRYLSFAGLLTAVLFAARTIFFANNMFLLLSMLVIAAAGLFFSYRIYLLQQAHSFNTPGSSKCNLYKGFECDKVFNSGFGKLLGILPLSEMALYYYTALLVLIFCHLAIPSLSTGITLVMLIAPVLIVPYSIFVQAVLIKSWCINCLKVMCMIVLNALLAGLLFKSQGMHIAAAECWLLLSIVSILFLSGVFIKRVIYRYRAFPEKGKALENIKSYQPLFSVMQESAGEVLCELPNDFKIDIGAAEKNTLVVVLSPFCPACKELFLQIQESYLLDDINCKIIIVLVTTAASESRKAGRLIAAAALQQEDDQNIIELLDLWYKESDCNRFKKRLDAAPGVAEMKKAEEILTRHAGFFAQQNADETPALFLNHRRINSFYEYSELKYFLV